MGASRRIMSYSVLSIALLVSCASADAVSKGSHLDMIKNAIQPLVEEYAKIFNTSISVGFTESIGSVTAQAGIQDVWTGNEMTPNLRVPVGSATKAFTAVAIMQHVEAGDINLDDLAATYIDPVLKRLNGSSLAGIWGTEVWNTITVNNLLMMTSGLKDYNNSQIESLTFKNPSGDVTPLDYIWLLDKTPVCEVNSCGFYSSVNYILLGFVLMGVRGTDSWEDLDQKSIIPDDLRETRYKNTFFPGRGPCSKYPNMSHQYAVSLKGREVTYEDLYYDSCLNGWTCGNMATTAEELSKFYYDLFVANILLKNSTSLYEPSTTITNGWCKGCLYGKGTIVAPLQSKFTAINPFYDNKKLTLRGHAGEDWGSSAWACGSNMHFKFGMCIVYNAVEGMNCPLYLLNVLLSPSATCHIYDAIIRTYGGPRILCPPGPGSLLETGMELHKNSEKYSEALEGFFKCKWERAPQ